MKRPWKKLLALALAAVVVLWLFLALGQVEKASRRQGAQQLELALRRGAVACYAQEGFYPPSLEYLCEHYAVQVDTERYYVFYQVFGENLMPEITVLER